MPITQLIIKNFKSIKSCNVSLADLNVFIGENGTGKTNLLDAINYFYCNLTSSNALSAVFDENNRYSNELRISLVYDFTGFLKIAKANMDESSDFSLDHTEDSNRYTPYYKKIISMASKTSDHKLRVELCQIKGRPISWNYSYEERLIFKSLFPIFHIDTRTLDITEWDHLWDILGELSKISNSQRELIENKVHSILLDKSTEISQKLNVISGIFESAEVSVQPAIAKEFAINLTKVYFSGHRIHHQGKTLDYYSAGTNSVKYIELLLKSIDAISRFKMKEPIVLFDEPEISLHTTYLDELAEAILDVNPKASLLLSTHSSRLTKDLISGSASLFLYNVKLIEHYSVIQRMKKFPQYSPSSKYRVADDHINAYFSKAILFVEGETELELFSNPYLKLLFPAFKKVDVFQAMSNTPILNIMSPKLANSQVPYLCLVDMDKAISYNQKSKTFSLSREYFTQNQKECYQYRNKHQFSPYLYHQRKQIDAMQKSLRVHYYKPFMSCDDPDYRAFISTIKSYLLSYNVFCLHTTIEGVLINTNTIAFSLRFLKGRTNPASFSAFEKYWESLQKTDQLNVLRILFNGKSDLLKSWKDARKNLDSSIESVLDKVMVGLKTSGWVSEYLDGFFKSASKMDGNFSERTFRKYLEDDKNRKEMLLAFQRNFPELSSLMSKTCDMIHI